jgi:hypothetical protein
MNDNGDMIVQAFGAGTTSNGIYYYLEADTVSVPVTDPIPVPQPVLITADNDADGICWSHDWLIIDMEITVIVPLDADSPHWLTETAMSGYHSSDYAVAAQNGELDRMFDWSTDITEARNYELFASWPADASNNNDAAAVYEIYSNAVLKGSFNANQTIAIPLELNQPGYISMGSFDLPANSKVSIKLKGSGQGNLIADEIKIEAL